MTGGQMANGIASSIAMVTSLFFIVVWTAVGRWWRTQTGRFMVLKAGAIGVTGLLTVWLTLIHFQNDWDILRYIQAILWILVSIAFLHHTRMVYKVNRDKEEK